MLYLIKPKVTSFLASYDIGVQLNTTSKNINCWLAVVNGTANNIDDNSQAKNFIERILFNPINGLNIGTSYYNGTNYVNKSTAVVDMKLVEKTVQGFELKYIKGFLGMEGEYLNNKEEYEGTKEEKSGYYFYLYHTIAKDFQWLGGYELYNDKTKGSKTKTYTLGLNYFLNGATKFSLNYLINNESGAKLQNNSVIAQMQVKF